MADAASTSRRDAPREPGAPVARDEIDPELVNLRKAGPRIGAVTGAGVAILCIYLVVRLLPDLAFSREADQPTRATAAKLGDNQFVEVPLVIERAHAVRLRQTNGGIGLRAVPVAGTSDALWLLMTGDGWADAVPNAAYAGRVRELDDLPLADALRDQVAAHPGPSFATLAAARAGFSTGQVTTVGGDTIKVAPGDRVELDMPIPDAALLTVTFNERLPGISVWVEALRTAGVATKGEPRDVTDTTAHIDATESVQSVTDKLARAQLYARIDGVSTTLATTWGELAKAGPLVINGATVDDARVDLLRISARRHIPDSARIVVLGELPADYWYVLPLAIGLALLGAVALWALARAIKRDYLAPKIVAAPTA